MTAPEASAPVLLAEDLHKTYRSGTREIPVLRGVSLRLEAGETLSIRGESGTGKTTLLNLLAGIEEPDQGRLFWNDQEVGRQPRNQRTRQRARFLGFVFQSYYLVPELNTLENVVLAARIAGQSPRGARQRAEALLDELGLADRLESQPAQLSGGERQRTAIARALVNQPRVILADEPTGNLDEHTAERVMEQFLAVVEGHQAALVLVTHHAGFASRATSRFRLEEGCLVPA